MSFHLINTPQGRLRVLGWIEGLTLIILVFIAVPLKYAYDQPDLARIMGPAHGAAFLLFLFNALSLSIRQAWSFRQKTWKVIAACFVPFGTFYIDRKILKYL